jgi:hypothetical protein
MRRRCRILIEKVTGICHWGIQENNVQMNVKCDEMAWIHLTQAQTEKPITLSELIFRFCTR